MDINRFKGANIRTDWSDWLGDMAPRPSAREELRHKRVVAANDYQRRPNFGIPVAEPAVTDGAPVKTVVVNLSLPNFRSLSLERLKAISRRQKIVYGSVVGTAAFMLLVASAPTTPKTDTGTSLNTAKNVALAANSQASTQLQTEAGTAPNTNAKTPVLSAKTSAGPSFTPVVPIDKPELAKSQFGRTAYDADRGVYTIMDTFMSAPLTINEEAVPKTYKTDSEALKAEAAKIGATQKVSTPTLSAYMQPSSNKMQTVVLASNGVLVFINSLVSHTADQWKNYLANLV